MSTPTPTVKIRKPLQRPLTLETIREIAAKVRVGNCRSVAAANVRVSEGQLSRWMTKGAHSPLGSIYRVLYEQVTESEAAWEIETVKLVQEDAVENPKSAQWLLTRHPSAKKRWASQDNVAQTAPAMASVDMNVARARFVDMMTKLAAELTVPTGPPTVEPEAATDADGSADQPG